MSTKAYIQAGPRETTWREIFGDDGVEIESPDPVLARVEIGGEDVLLPFFKVRVAALTTEQRARVERYLSEKFGAPVEEIAIDLDSPEHGLPVLATDLIIASDERVLN